MSSYIGIYENALSDNASDYIMNLFNTDFKKHKGVAGVDKLYDPDKKDSTDLNLMEYGKEKIPPQIFQELENSLTKYLVEYSKDHPLNAHFVDATKEERENRLWNMFSVFPFSILCKKYNKGKGGYHVWHSDRGSSSTSKHRYLVCMYYLNDVEEGGETEFYGQKLKVKPKKGSLVIFPATFTHMHKGHVPISNDKYIMNFWILKGKPIQGDLERMRDKYFLIEPKNSKILN